MTCLKNEPSIQPLTVIEESSANKKKTKSVNSQINYYNQNGNGCYGGSQTLKTSSKLNKVSPTNSNYNDSAVLAVSSSRESSNPHFNSVNVQNLVT